MARKSKAASEPKKAEKPVIPLKERPGYCKVCAGHFYKLKFSNRQLIRTCKTCGDELIL